MTACVSWLKLELHHLGELPELGGHIDGCSSCRERLASIAGDDRPLPALPRPVSAPSPWWRHWSLPALAFAAAAALLLVLPSEVPPSRTTWKGGELAVSVVGEGGASAESFLDGDRFKVLLTVVPGSHPWRVLVFQDGQVFEPLQGGTTPGGNRTPLPGAFRLTGPGNALVCVVVDGSSDLDRPEDLGLGAVCQGLAFGGREAVE